jgi:hypothetical protein
MVTIHNSHLLVASFSFSFIFIQAIWSYMTKQSYCWNINNFVIKNVFLLLLCIFSPTFRRKGESYFTHLDAGVIVWLILRASWFLPHLRRDRVDTLHTFFGSLKMTLSKVFPLFHIAKVSDARHIPNVFYCILFKITNNIIMFETTN